MFMRAPHGRFKPTMCAPPPFFNLWIRPWAIILTLLLNSDCSLLLNLMLALYSLLFRYTLNDMASVVKYLLIAALLLSHVGPSQQDARAVVKWTAHAAVKLHPTTKFAYRIYDNTIWALNLADFLWTGPSHSAVLTWLVKNPPPLLTELMPRMLLDYLAQFCDYYNLPICTNSVKFLQYVV